MLSMFDNVQHNTSRMCDLVNLHPVESLYLNFGSSNIKFKI